MLFIVLEEEFVKSNFKPHCKKQRLRAENLRIDVKVLSKNFEFEVKGETGIIG